MNIKIFFVGFLVIFLSGCSVKFNNHEFGKQIDKTLKNNSKVFYNKMKKEEKIEDDKYLMLSSPKTLSIALGELGEIQNKIYMLNDSSLDISLKTLSASDSYNLKINTFQKLKKFIEDTTSYSIKITKNKFIKNAIKIVTVINKKEIESKINNITFTVKGKKIVSDILQEIAKLTHFSIVYSYDFQINSNNFAGENSDLKNFFDSQKIYYTGSSIADFLNYISTMFNVFIDINYNKKIIVISRYKTKFFHLVIPESKMDVKNAALEGTATTQNSTTNNTGGTTQQSGSSGGVSGETINSKLTVSVVTKLLNSLKAFVSQDANSKILLNDNGMIVVKTTKNNMKTIEKMIDKYNKTYLKQIDIGIEFYEFLLSKNFNIGTDIGYSNSRINSLTSFLTDIIFRYNYKNKTVNANWDNDFIRFSKKYSFNTVFTNNIPMNFNITNSESYIKSITSTTTTGTATTTASTVEIGDIVEGQILTVLPRVFGNKVFIKSEIKIKAKNEVKTVPVGDTTITLPNVSEDRIPSNAILSFGDKKLIGFYETYEDINTYKGVLPIENFIIGGKNGKKYVKKLIAIVIEIHKK